MPRLPTRIIQPPNIVDTSEDIVHRLTKSGDPITSELYMRGLSANGNSGLNDTTKSALIAVVSNPGICQNDHDLSRLPEYQHRERSKWFREIQRRGYVWDERSGKTETSKRSVLLWYPTERGVFWVRDNVGYCQFFVCYKCGVTIQKGEGKAYPAICSKCLIREWDKREVYETIWGTFKCQ